MHLIALHNTSLHNTRQTTGRNDHTSTRRVSTETKASFKTNELIAYVAAVVGVLIASAMADGASDFGWSGPIPV